jgi:hypothetical protein
MDVHHDISDPVNMLTKFLEDSSASLVSAKKQGPDQVINLSYKDAKKLSLNFLLENI